MIWNFQIRRIFYFIRVLDNDTDKYLAMLRENPMQPNFDFEQQIKVV